MTPSLAALPDMPPSEAETPVSKGKRNDHSIQHGLFERVRNEDRLGKAADGNQGPKLRGVAAGEKCAQLFFRVDADALVSTCTIRRLVVYEVSLSFPVSPMTLADRRRLHSRR